MIVERYKLKQVKATEKVSYLFQSYKNPEIIASNGLNINGSLKSIIEDFNAFIGRKTLTNHIEHTVFSFSKTDNVNGQLMKSIVDEFTERFMLQNHLYISVRHFDQPKTDHFHLINSVLDINGNRSNDSNSRRRCFHFAREMEVKHNLQRADQANNSLKTQINQLIQQYVITNWELDLLRQEIEKKKLKLKMTIDDKERLKLKIQRENSSMSFSFTVDQKNILNQNKRNEQERNYRNTSDKSKSIGGENWRL